MPALAESWLPAPTQRSCAHFMISAAGFAFGRQFLALHLHYFRLLSPWPKQAAGLNYFEDVTVAFPGPASSWKQSSRSHPVTPCERWAGLLCWSCLWAPWSGVSSLLRNITLPTSLLPDQQSSAGHCWHCAATAGYFLTGERNREKVLKTWKFLSFLALNSVAIIGDLLKSGSSCHIRYTLGQNKGFSLPK